MTTKAQFLTLRGGFPGKYIAQWDLHSSYHSFNDSIIIHGADSVKSTVLSDGNR